MAQCFHYMTDLCLCMMDTEFKKFTIKFQKHFRNIMFDMCVAAKCILLYDR